MPKPKPVILSEAQRHKIQKTKIFIASSNDLSHERKEIVLWASRKNKKLIEKNKYIDLILWEDLLHSFQGDRVSGMIASKKVKKGTSMILCFYRQAVANFKEKHKIIDVPFSSIK